MAAIAAPTATDALLSVPEACTRLGVSRATLYRILGRGELTPTYVGRRPRFSPDAIERYLGRQEHESVSDAGSSSPARSEAEQWVRDVGYVFIDDWIRERLRHRGVRDDEIEVLLRVADELREP